MQVTVFWLVCWMDYLILSEPSDLFFIQWENLWKSLILQHGVSADACIKPTIKRIIECRHDQPCYKSLSHSIPAVTWRCNDVGHWLDWRLDVNPTNKQRRYNVMCLLGYVEHQKHSHVVMNMTMAFCTFFYSAQTRSHLCQNVPSILTFFVFEAWNFSVLVMYTSAQHQFCGGLLGVCVSHRCNMYTL